VAVEAVQEAQVEQALELPRLLKVEQEEQDNYGLILVLPSDMRAVAADLD
jgi:hypothetical protein